VRSGTNAGAFQPVGTRGTLGGTVVLTRANQVRSVHRACAGTTYIRGYGLHNPELLQNMAAVLSRELVALSVDMGLATIFRV
jgi:hypothetical protein